MNPVLLKPQTDTGAQVIVQGRAGARCARATIATLKAALLPAVLDSFCHLAARAPTSSSSKARAARPRSTCAPATSPTWASPRAANVPVVLVGDIDRGGVIASLVGTHAVLEPDDAARIAASSSTSSAAIPACSPTA